jgi:Skp family chaperone for outer membrane proteins
MKLRNIVLAAAFVASASSVAGVAMAQTKVYIVNETRVMIESKLGKAMNQQLSQDAQQAVEQLGLKTLKTEADTERAALQPQIQSLTPEAITANPTLKTRVENLNKKYNELMQKSSALDQGVEQQRTANAVRFNYALVPAIDAVAKQVGADVVLSYGSALYNKESVDISAKVIERLDATVPTLEALKPLLPQRPAAPAAPNAGGGQ